MQAPILVFLTLLLAGAATALQGPTNARLVTAVGSPLNAAFVSFAVGTVALGHPAPGGRRPSASAGGGGMHSTLACPPRA